jgi:hypothetical protein
MLVCESMEACISVYTCAKSSICCLSSLIPSTARSAWSTPYLTYRSNGAYQLGYLVEVVVLARRLGSSNREMGSNYHPHGDPSSHPHTPCPTRVTEGEPAV